MHLYRCGLVSGTGGRRAREILQRSRTSKVAAWSADDFTVRRGATRPQLRNRALLLAANLPLALLYLLGTSVAAIQRVEVINRSGRPIEELTLTACRSARCEVGTLAPGERYVWKFCPPTEGTLSLTGQQAGEPLTLDDACMFFIFCRIDVSLELQPGGEWSVREAPGAPWSWAPGR